MPNWLCVSYIDITQTFVEAAFFNSAKLSLRFTHSRYTYMPKRISIEQITFDPEYWEKRTILPTVSITQSCGEEPGNEITLTVECDKDSATNYTCAVM